MGKDLVMGRLTDAVDDARGRMELRRDGLRQAREDLTSEGVFHAARGIVRRFRENNHEAINTVLERKYGGFI